MQENIRLIIFQMLVLADYSGDKDEFISRFIKDCQKSLSPAYASASDYYTDFQKAVQKSINQFVRDVTPRLSSTQVRNLHLLAQSVGSV